MLFQDILGILKFLLPLLANTMSSMNSEDANISVLWCQGTSSTVNYDASPAPQVSTGTHGEGGIYTASPFTPM